MSFRKLAISLLALLVFALATVPLMAQSSTTGDITGTVTDSSGAIVPKATVTAKSTDTGASATTTTNSSGYYHFSYLKPGNYTVSAEAAGMQPTTRGAAVLIGQETDVNIQVGVKGESTTVEVTAEAPLLQTENANIATSYTSKQMDLIPNPGNDLTYVAQTSPGVLMNSSSGGGYGNFNAFGLPATANLFTVNGNDENDPYLNLNNSGATNLLLGKNELQEAVVVSNGYTGQYGRQAGAQVDYATKSGSNSWHGNAEYDWTGLSLSADDWFVAHTATKPGFDNNNQWAASFGGPIKKDKTFFFVDTEGLRYILSTSTQTFVPTLPFEKAVNSALAGSAGGFSGATAASIPFYQNMWNLFNGAAGSANATFDPTAASNFGCGDLNLPGTIGKPTDKPGTSNQGFFNPELAGFGDPAAVAGNPNAPAVTGGSPCLNQFRSTAGQLSHEWILSGRLDQVLGDKDKLFGRYRMDRGTQATYTDAINPVFNAISVQPQYEGQLNETHVFSQNAVNQAIISGSWYSAFFNNPNHAASLAAFPYALESFDFPLGTTNTNLVSLGGENNSFPQGRNVTQYMGVDDFSITHGNHTFKTGVNFKREDITDGIFGVRTVPRQRIFSTTDFVNGFIDQTSIRFPTALEQPIALYSLGAYFQDEWRASSNLKFTMALRADQNSNPVCQRDCFTLLTAGNLQGNGQPGTTPYNQVVTTGLHQALNNVEKVAVQPRFGFTYSPLGHKSTVIRGGVGLFSDLYPGTLVDPLARNAPGDPTFTTPGGLLSPAEPSNSVSVPTACNTAFQTNFKAGGNQPSFVALGGPNCTRPDFTAVTNTVKNPKYAEYNLEIQQQIGNRTAVSANYVGNHGYDLLSLNPGVNAFSAKGTFPTLPTTRPDGHFNNVSDLTNNGWSNYNGVTFQVNRKLGYGFQGSLNYTYAHAQDTLSNGGGTAEPYSFNDSLVGQLDPNNLRRLNYGNADYDVRHNITANYIWELPFKSSNNFMNYLVGGWELSQTYFWHTGYPYSVDLNPGTGPSNYVNGQALADFTGGIGFNTCTSGPSTKLSTTQCLPLFTSGPNIGTAANFAIGSDFGNLARNSFRGPGYFNTDLSVMKAFKLTERVTFKLGANAYNILNHPNFGNPDHNIQSGTFGQFLNTDIPPTSPYGSFVGSAVSGRIIQLTGRINF